MKLVRAWAESFGKIIVKVTTEKRSHAPIWGESVKLHDGDFLFDPMDSKPGTMVRFRVDELNDEIEILTESGRVINRDIKNIEVFDEDYNEIDVEDSDKYKLEKSFDGYEYEKTLVEENSLLETEKENYEGDFFDGMIDEVRIYDTAIEGPKKEYSKFL